MEEEDIQLDKEGIDDSVIAEEAQGETIKKLRQKVKDAEGKAKEHLDNWQRAQAEFVNLRKRDEEAQTQFVKFAKGEVLSELIPVLDALSSAVSHGEKSVEPIQNLFLKILKQHGLEEIDPLGEAFDPRLHEAVGVIPTTKEDEDHKVLEVFQKGYIMSGKTLRPAKVRIGEFTH
ncbi:MAG: GrpE protein molecular chaperone GrpE [Parcubacteria group bacterium]|nr:GrpE protein molecular chaperone GrpE [Parcubacteria group bacterium]